MSAPTELGGQETYIGDIVTQSEMTTSLFGDEHLYYRHQKASDDFALQPDWEPYYPAFSQNSEQFYEYLTSQADPECPFAAMLKYFAQ